MKLNVVLPSTFSTESSYVASLAAAGSPHVAPATAFISHAYDDEFLGVLDAVAALEAREGTSAFYYFDLLVVNQHGQGAVVPFEVLRDEFGRSVRAIGRTLLVLRWANPIPLQRAWCVFEMATTLAVGAGLKVLMPPVDAEAFRRALEGDFDSLTYKTCSVDVKNASAREASDLANIQRVIRETCGFLKTNQLVIGAMQSWMVEEGQAALAAMEEGKRGTSALINNLANLLRDQGKLGKAEPLFLEALTARRRTLGNEHPDTLNIINNFANLLHNQRKVGEAEPLYLEALAARQRTLGNEHPDTLASISNLAILLHNQGKVGEAEPLYLEALAVKRRTLGNEHPSTLASIYNLAVLLKDQRKFDEAESLCLEALAARQRTLGNEHPDTLSSINSLATLLKAQGRLDEAEPLFIETLVARQRTLGNEHPSTLESIFNYAALLHLQDKREEALEHYRLALEGMRHVHGEDHPSTEQSLSGYLQLLWESQARFHTLHPDSADHAALLPQALAAVAHPHALVAVVAPGEYPGDRSICDACGANNLLPDYHCAACGFDLCSTCYSLATGASSREGASDAFTAGKQDTSVAAASAATSAAATAPLAAGP